MSAVPPRGPAPEAVPRRNSPRHPITVPLDVITLRSGIPHSVPGRCTDISETGIGAAVAGELAVNQHVAIELRLPQVASPLRARAIVRHHTLFQCGLQFVNLSVEQREMIRFWAHRNAPPPAETKLPQIAVQQSELPTSAAVPVKLKSRRKIRLSRRQLVVLLAVTLVLAACAWLYWQWAWSRLENPGSTANFYSRDEKRLFEFLRLREPCTALVFR